MTAHFPPFARSGRSFDDEEVDIYDDGRLRVEHDNYHVVCHGQALKFPRTEFLLLSRLVRNVGRIVKAEELWRHAWGDVKHYNPESLHVHIYRLRHKLAPFDIHIETMVSVGYRLLVEARTQTPSHENVKDREAPRSSVSS